MVTSIDNGEWMKFVKVVADETVKHPSTSFDLTLAFNLNSDIIHKYRAWKMSPPGMATNYEHQVVYLLNL